MRKNIFRVLTLTALSAFLLNACGDEVAGTPIHSDDQDPVSVIPSDSTKKEQPEEASSSSEQSSSSSSSSSQRYNWWGQWGGNPWGSPPSSSSKKTQSSSSTTVHSSTSCKELRGTTNKFHNVMDVFKCVNKNEKVAFVLRHAARNKNDTGDQGKLNDEGRTQSVAFGKKLKDVGDIYFMNTKVYRTMETVLKIVEGSGQEFSESRIPFSSKIGVDHEQSEDLEDPYLIKNQGKYQSCRDKFSWGWSPYSYYAFEENVSRECQETFYDIDDRLAEFVQAHFTYDRMHNVTLAISHDKLLMPMVIAVSKRQIDLRFHAHENTEKQFDYWINYLTGIAIIVDENNNSTLLPVTALDDPLLRTFPDN